MHVFGPQVVRFRAISVGTPSGPIERTTPLVRLGNTFRQSGGLTKAYEWPRL